MDNRQDKKRPLFDRILANAGWLLGAIFAAPMRPKHWTWKTELAIAVGFASIVCIAVLYYLF